MTEIIAIVRRKRASATRTEFARIGCSGYSVFPVLGRGKQRGLRTEQGGEGLAFLPKTLFDLIVEDPHVQETIEAIIRANQTGELGDGKIFVIEIAETYRISTGEREPTAETVGVAAG